MASTDAGLPKIEDSLLTNPDRAILLNVFTSGGYFIVVVLILILIRPYIPVYRAILYGQYQRRITGIQTGRLGWLKTVFTLSNERLLAISGLDSYVYIQSLKLIGILTTILALLNVASLLPTYVFGKATRDSWSKGILWGRLSLGFVPKRPELLWLPTIMAIVSTLVIFYFVYMFFRNISTVRQAYLFKPSAFVPLSELEEVTAVVDGNFQAAKQVFDVSGRAIILQGIDKCYSKSRLQKLFTNLGFHIEGIVLVKSRQKLDRMIDERNAVFLKLESLYHHLYYKLPKPSSSIMSPTRSSSFSEDEKSKLIGQITNDSAVCKDLRPCTKQGEDKIKLCYSQLITLEQNLEAIVRHNTSDEVAEYQDDRGETSSEINVYATPNNSSVDAGNETTGQIINSQPINLYEDDNELRDDMNNDVPISSMSSQSKLNWESEISLVKTPRQRALLGSSNSAIVVFKELNDASIAKQTLFSSRPFAMISTPSPTARDLLWSNLYMSRLERIIRKYVATFVCIMLNILFASMVAFISNFLELQRLQNYTWVRELLERNLLLRDALAGILEPLIFNLFLWIVPKFLLLLAYFEGRISHSDCQASVFARLVTLLYLQTFLVVFTGPIVNVIWLIYQGQYTQLFTEIKSYMPTKAAFFLNVIVQQTLIDLANELAMVSGLVKGGIKRILASTQPTARKLATFREPELFFVGKKYANGIGIVFMLAMPFALATPLILIAASVYYFLAYWVYRSVLIYSAKIEAEAGGVYWLRLANTLMVGAVVLQIFTAIQVGMLGANLQLLFLIPVTIVTIFSIGALNRAFSKPINNVPLSGEGQVMPRVIMEKIELIRSDIINELPDGEPLLPSKGKTVDKETENGICYYDRVSFDFGCTSATKAISSSIGSKQHSPVLSTISSHSVSSQEHIDPLMPYSNPLYLKTLNHIILPHDFFLRVKLYLER